MTNEEFLKIKKCIIKKNDVLYKNELNEYVSIFETYLYNKNNLIDYNHMLYVAVELMRINQNLTRLNTVIDKEENEYNTKNVQHKQKR